MRLHPSCDAIDLGSGRRLDLIVLGSTASEYQYADARPAHDHNYYLVPALKILRKAVLEGCEPRVFDLGCGNGAIAALLHDAGFVVSGVDASQSGIAAANRVYPYIDLRVGSAYEDLASCSVGFQSW